MVPYRLCIWPTIFKQHALRPGAKEKDRRRRKKSSIGVRGLKTFFPLSFHSHQVSRVSSKLYSMRHFLFWSIQSLDWPRTMSTPTWVPTKQSRGTPWRLEEPLRKESEGPIWSQQYVLVVTVRTSPAQERDQGHKAPAMPRSEEGARIDRGRTAERRACADIRWARAILVCTRNTS